MVCFHADRINLQQISKAVEEKAAKLNHVVNNATDTFVNFADASKYNEAEEEFLEDSIPYGFNCAQ